MTGDSVFKFSQLCVLTKLKLMNIEKLYPEATNLVNTSSEKKFTF